MIRISPLPLRRAARHLISCTILLGLGLSPALQAQDPPAEDAPAAETAPADAAPVGESAPAEGAAAAEAAPAEGAAPAEAASIPVPGEAPAEEAAAAPAGEGGTQLDTIEVTGSRIKRTDFETAQPVLVIRREDIDRTGLTSIGDLLQDLPNAGAAINTAFNGFVDVGGVEVDLRNLGSNRVLVLVNGHRWVNGLRSLGTSIVDLSTIPLSIIERIEVLKDGASAIYGSDAVAGVVNIITRKDYSGAEVRSYVAGYAEYGDGLTHAHNISAGSVMDKTQLFIDLSYTQQREVFNGDRELTQYPTFGTGVSRGSGNTPQGKFTFIPTPATQSALVAADPNACPGLVDSGEDLPIGGGVDVGAVPLCIVMPNEGTAGTAITDFRRFNNVTDPYNFAPENYLSTPYQQSSLFAQLGHQLTDSISFNSELFYNTRRSVQRAAHMPILLGDLAGVPPFSTVYIDKTNIYNIFAQNVGRPDDPNVPLGPGSGAVQRRPLEYGPRLFTQVVDTMRAGFAFSGPLELNFGEFNRLLSWELGYSYGESREDETLQGLFNEERVKKALGPNIDCVNSTDNCVPLNLFGGQGVDGRGTITREMLDYISYTGVGNTRQLMRDTYLNVSTEAFNLPTGPVGLALGIELRDEFYQQTPDPLVAAGISSNNNSQPTAGGYDSLEYYAELAIPVVRDLPFAQEIDLSLAGRSSDYAGFGSAETGKAGLRWKPIDDLLVRGTFSTAFRAPSVGELFLGDADSFPGLVDPCSSDIRADDPERNTNCGPTGDNVPATNVQVIAQLLEKFQGNQNLKPETAETFTAGFVYSPAQIPDLNLYVDYYSIKVDDYITVLGGQFILDACYDEAERSYCHLVNRDPGTGVIEYVENPFLNISRLETSGIDFTADYLLPWGKDLGNFKLLFDSTCLTQFDFYNPTTTGGETIEESFLPGRHAGFGPFPRFKANGALDWKQGNWNASWAIRYIHHMKEPCNVDTDIFDPDLYQLGLCSDPKPPVEVADDPGTPDTDESLASTPDLSENELKATFYHNVQLGYAIPNWNTSLTFGVNNLFDQDPPPSYAFVQSPSWDFTAYEAPGRFPYLRLQKNF
jgi:iron complex outermembrane receptor protein